MQKSVTVSAGEFVKTVAGLRCHEEVRQSWAVSRDHRGACFSGLSRVSAGRPHLRRRQPANPLLQWWRLLSPAQTFLLLKKSGHNRSIPIAKLDIFRLGVRSATDFVQKLPVATGPSINENINTIGDGQTEIDLRGLASKETLVLQDGRRLAPNGIAGFDVGFNSFFGGTVDLNLFPTWAD